MKRKFVVKYNYQESSVFAKCTAPTPGNSDCPVYKLMVMFSETRKIHSSLKSDIKLKVRVITLDIQSISEGGVPKRDVQKTLGNTMKLLCTTCCYRGK